jgi:3-keto-L-gulonate-6-phosphate decarboxylase
MRHKTTSKLNSKKRYLQVALNGTLSNAQRIISELPISDRIIVEAGTPLIKRYGEQGIRQIRQWFEQRLYEFGSADIAAPVVEQFDFSSINLSGIFSAIIKRDYSSLIKSNKPTVKTRNRNNDDKPYPYVVADLKTMDRGGTEVEMAARAGASAVVALGNAPVETLNAFIESCETFALDAMIDMMNVEYPLAVLRALKKVPPVVILHRGVDEEQFNKQKQIPLHEIRRIKGNFDIMISIAGGDTIREVQRSIFNDGDIVVIWKSVYQSTGDTIGLVEEFLKEIK